MITVKAVAQAFAAGESAKCGNAITDGTTYWLHGNIIAAKNAQGVRYDWCGWYGPTTANHLNAISGALDNGFRFSYRQFRDFTTGYGYFSELPHGRIPDVVFEAHFALHE